MLRSIENEVARHRLRWAARGAAAVAAINMALEVMYAHWWLQGLNGVLVAVGIGISLAVGRGRIRTMSAISAAGGVLSTLLTATTIWAFTLGHGMEFVVMIALQFLAAGTLYFSTRWLIGYLGAAVLATGVAFAMCGYVTEFVIAATTAVLAVTFHLVLGEVQRRRDLEHATEIGSALAAREAAVRDAERYQEQLLQSQKMEAIGTLAGGIAHDMNNALAGIIGITEMLAEDARDAQARADLGQILQAAQRAADLTRNLLGFSRRGSYRRTRVASPPLLQSVMNLLARTLPKGVRVEISLTDETTDLLGDASMLSHALVNLCINASDAMAGRGLLTLACETQQLDAAAARGLAVAPGRYVVLAVRDTGSGMDEATRARVFEPFFTTKDPGRGTGLGLAMVYGTVKRHEGAITIDTALGVGTTFRLFLPVATGGASDHAEPAPLPPSAAVVGARILVVDDEPLARSALDRALVRAGYVVTSAVDGRDGLDALVRVGGQFELVILDMAMPRMTGHEMFHAARAQFPELQVLLTTGYAPSQLAQPLLASGALGVLEKPFDAERMLQVVAHAIRGAPRAAGALRIAV